MPIQVGWAKCFNGLMSFFPTEPTSTAKPERGLVDRWDPRSGNFPGFLGIPVSVEVEPYRTDDFAFTMDQFRAFPEGFRAAMTVIARPGLRLHEDLEYPNRAPGRLRVGIEMSDGRRGYEFDERSPGGDFFIWSRGRSSSPFRHRLRLWVHAIPPPGPMELVVTWPDVGLTEARVSIATEAIVGAISRAAPVWGD